MEPEPLHTVPPPLLNNNTVRVGSSNRLLYWTVALGAVAALLSTYLLLTTATTPKEQKLLVGVDFGKGSGLYEFVTVKKTGKPSLIPYVLSTADNKTLRVIDTVSVKEIKYYLLQEDAETSNVYEHKEKQLIRVTNTKSLKRNLSYDEVSGTLAYESSTIASPSATPWNIYLFSIKEKKETSTQIMSVQSQLVAGGAGLFVVSSSSMEYVALPGGMSTSVLHSIDPQKTLLSKDGTSVFVFDSVSRTINTYTMKPGSGVSFSGASVRLSFDPITLGFSQGDLYIVSEDKRSPPFGFQLQNLRTGLKSQLLVPRNAVITSVSYE